MTNEPVTGNPAVRPSPRAQTMALQSVGNRIVRGLLRTPLVSRFAGSRLVTLYIVGRKSGRRYTVPVAYTGSEGDLLIGTPFGWGRNLRTGEPVEIRLKGRRRQADVEVMTDERAVTDAYGDHVPRQPHLRQVQPRRPRLGRPTRTRPTCTWPGRRGRARSG